MGHRDGFRDALVRAAAILGRRQSAAVRLNRYALGAWDGVPRDAMADAIPEVHQRRGADAEKLAAREPDVRARDGWQSAGRVEERSAARGAAAAVPALCTPVSDQSAAQSFSGRAAEAAEPAQPVPQVGLRLLEVQMPEAHSLAQREQQEPARRARAEAQELMRA
jgi:hypothetical protein